MNKKNSKVIRNQTLSICIRDWVKNVEQEVGYNFVNQQLLIVALTHPSYRAEQKVNTQDNQRLEFLGDAVVELIVSKRLFNTFQTKNEGEMSHMRSAVINRFPLAKMGVFLNLNKHLFIGKGEQRVNGANRDTTLCDAFEALIGAIYLDGGFDCAEKVFWRVFEACGFDLERSVTKFNPKGELQELTQGKLGVLPIYNLLSVEGPEHQPLYRIEVSVGEKWKAQAEGPNRKQSESLAASKMLEILRNLDLTS
ncbi:MAG: ribonuclease III [Lentisphaeria bacterium]